MGAYTGGISTRKVDALVEALGGDSGISKSEVSRTCQGLNEQVKAFLGRPLDHAHFPYVVYLDATYLHGRLGRNLQVVSRAVVVVFGINALGYREVLGNSFSSRSLRQRRRLRLRRGRQRGRGLLASVPELALARRASGPKAQWERGLTGTRLVISVGEAFPGRVAHLGLTAAIKRMFQGCSWRCQPTSKTAPALHLKNC
jgi:putative transposase